METSLSTDGHWNTAGIGNNASYNEFAEPHKLFFHNSGDLVQRWVGPVHFLKERKHCLEALDKLISKCLGGFLCERLADRLLSSTSADSTGLSDGGQTVQQEGREPGRES